MKEVNILKTNKSLLTKTAHKYRLSIDQAFKMIKHCPNLRTKLLSQDDANKLALLELLHGEGLVK